MIREEQGAKASYVLLTLVFLAWCFGPSVIRRFTREAFVEFQAPALELAGRSRDLARYWELRTRSTEELAEAGRDLGRINAGLELRLIEMKGLAEENARLRTLLSYGPAPEYRTVVARVVARDSTGWWHRITIRKGRTDGVRPFSPVVFGNQVIGRVAQVHLNTSDIDLITSPGFRCTAHLDGDEQRRVVLLTGTASGSRGSALVTNVPKDYGAPAGQEARLMTTGIGGVFPAGLLLGHVDGPFRPTPKGDFREAEVTPPRALNSIREVAVLVPVYPTPGEQLTESRVDDFR
ncbi:MAG: rod shape-determining protein MreC [Verrucomicrobia bacterium]|nr:rod shape-determining protein MreC [Verrucomicrobiota bacterium]